MQLCNFCNTYCEKISKNKKLCQVCTIVSRDIDFETYILLLDNIVNKSNHDLMFVNNYEMFSFSEILFMNTFNYYDKNKIDNTRPDLQNLVYTMRNEEFYKLDKIKYIELMNNYFCYKCNRKTRLNLD